jgi:hypothetical protein
MKYTAKIFILLMGSFMLPIFVFAVKPRKPVKSHIVYITLKLKSDVPVSVTKAALKYNKHLAFSFTLDDGYWSAYLTAFPLLNGGQISPPFPDEWKNDEGGDGSYSKGLFYSDGCHHNVPFRIAAAINAAGINDMPVNRGHLSWPEVKALYNGGWDILNHGYHHATKHGTDFDYEVQQNIIAVNQQLGFTMTQFVVPGGEADPGYEHDYERSAIKYGNNAVASIKGDGPIISVNAPVNLTAMIYARDFIRSEGDSLNFNTANRSLKLLDSLMQLSKSIWFNEFTHGTGNSNLWNLSLRFPEFKYYMTAIANKYGVTGSDNIWMAPWQEVYEYIWLRDRIKLSTTRHGKQVVIKIEVPDLPDGFRHRAISLGVVNTASTFTVAANGGDVKVTSNKQLINLEL